MPDASIKEVVKEHLGIVELTKTQSSLLATIEKFIEADKE